MEKVNNHEILNDEKNITMSSYRDGKNYVVCLFLGRTQIIENSLLTREAQTKQIRNWRRIFKKIVPKCDRK